MKRFNQGFTLVEVVISMALLLVVIVAGYQGFFFVQTSIAYTHYKMAATDLANEQFEIIKNLPYSSVGVVNGDPSGVVLASQTLVRGSASYTVTVSIHNVDDPFDNTPVDSFSHDYKLVEVSIGCQTCKNFTPIVFTGQVAPANLESI